LDWLDSIVLILCILTGEGLRWVTSWEVVMEDCSSAMGALAGADFLEEGAFLD
jgi:hypothetical protein